MKKTLILRPEVFIYFSHTLTLNGFQKNLERKISYIEDIKTLSSTAKKKRKQEKRNDRNGASYYFNFVGFH